MVNKYRKEQNKRRWMLSIYSSKWFSFPWSYKFRVNAYKRSFNWKYNAASIEENVWILRTHSIPGEIIIGKNLVLTKNVMIDYTGGIEIGDNVTIAEGAKILTHGHDFFGFREDVIPAEKNLFQTKLIIRDNVTIGTRSIIMSGVKEIGENSIISAGSVVTKRVPDNVVVAGNPARIIAKLPKGLKIIQTNLL